MHTHAILKTLMSKRDMRGFTIVELLIVIVIIGILAALIITAYNGIQARANNTQTMSAVTAHIKALRQYASDNGSWPAFAVTGWPCFGDAYVAKDGFSTSQCGQTPGTCVNSGVSCGTSTNSTYTADLKSYYNNSIITTPSQQLVNYNGTNYRGGWVHANTSTSTLGIRYWLSGDVSCGSPGGITAAKQYSDVNSAVCLVTIPAL